MMDKNALDCRRSTTKSHQFLPSTGTWLNRSQGLLFIVYLLPLAMKQIATATTHHSQFTTPHYRIITPILFISGSRVKCISTILSGKKINFLS